VKIGTGFVERHARAVITVSADCTNTVQERRARIDGWPMP
jgi:hypothetical protein